MDGYAADFVCPDFGTPLEVARAIARSGLTFDQVIQEGAWVHLSFDPLARRERLTAKFGPGGPVYTPGA
jgi:putative chitinase